MPSQTLDVGMPKHLRRLKLLLYGAPKSGKTVTAHSMPRTRTLDFDDGMGSVVWAIKEGIITRPPEQIVYSTISQPINEKRGKMVLDLASEQVDEWLDEEDIDPDKWNKPYDQFWDTLIIDSATFLTQATITKGLKENDRMNLSKSWQQYRGGVTDLRVMKRQDWGAGQALFWKFAEWVTTLGKNVVMLAHEYQSTNDSGAVLSIDPAVIGQLRSQIPALFDEVWYQNTKGSKKNARHVIQTKRDGLRNLGSRLGCLDAEEDADFVHIKNKVAKFYGVNPDDLWTAYHGQSGAERAQQEAEEEEGAAI